jgi:outer membrane cobalamin receptor
VTLGVARTLRADIRVSAEGYYQALDQLVVRPDRTTGLASNTGSGYTTGVDLLVAKRLVDQWYGQITYSAQRSRRDDNLGEGSYNSDFHRPHIFNTLLSYEFNDRW